MELKTTKGLTIPTKHLRIEHDKMLISLKILKKICETHEHINDIEKILEYLNFIDKRHSQKEVTLIIYAMNERQGENNPFAKLLEEHNENKKYLKELVSFVKKYPKPLMKFSALSASIQSYIEFITRHIEKENTKFYPLAEKNIPQEKYPKILNEFAVIDRETETEDIKFFDEALDLLKTKYIQNYE